MNGRQDILLFKDLNPSLIIDFGSDNFKYCQPVMNTSLMTKELIDNKKNEVKFMKVQGEETKSHFFQNPNLSLSLTKLSTNTIYDINFAKKMNLIDPSGPYDEYKFTYKDTLGVSDTVNKYNFPFEPVYQGKINDEASFEKYLKKFKAKAYNPYVLKIKNRDEFFKETPIIILQDCYPLKDLYKQVSKLYKFFFEEFQSPYVLVQSKPSLDIFSHNLETGIVIDFGDSKTSFTPIVNGFPDYKNTKFNTFLSGRTITNFFNLMKFDGKDYVKAKEMKEKSCFLEENISNSVLGNFINYNHEHNYCFLNYLFVYPELFKSYFRNQYFGGKPLKFHNYSLENIKKLVKRKYYSGEEARNELVKKIDDFKSDMDTLYKNTSNESGFKLKEYEGNLLNIKLMEFKQYSLAHLILMNISKLLALKSPVIGKDSIDIVLTGGVLNSVQMIPTIKDEIKEIDNRFKNFKFHCFENIDHCFGFAKGANYLCNMDNLSSLMVSKKDYDEQGADNLGYNYI